jgi:hypothetical protein
MFIIPRTSAYWVIGYRDTVKLFTKSKPNGGSTLERFNTAESRFCILEEREARLVSGSNISGVTEQHEGHSLRSTGSYLAWYQNYHLAHSWMDQAV